MDYLHNTGLDRILDDMAKAHEGRLKQYDHDPVFHAVVTHILKTNRDGRFTLPKWQDALALAMAFSAPQPPNPPQPTPVAETPRKTAPGGRETGQELEGEGEGDRWDMQD
jgi:hypothetical protein